MLCKLLEKHVAELKFFALEIVPSVSLLLHVEVKVFIVFVFLVFEQVQPSCHETLVFFVLYAVLKYAS